MLGSLSSKKVKGSINLIVQSISGMCPKFQVTFPFLFLGQKQALKEAPKVKKYPKNSPEPFKAALMLKSGGKGGGGAGGGAWAEDNNCYTFLKH